METRTRHDRYLSAEQRAMIAIGMKQGQSMQAIAAPAAGLGYGEWRRRCVRRRKLIEGSRLWQAVHDRLLSHHWSPEQIEATLPRMHPVIPPGRSATRRSTR